MLMKKVKQEQGGRNGKDSGITPYAKRESSDASDTGAAQAVQGGFQKALKQNPQVKYKGTFVDKDGVGVCDWEAPNAQAVEKICKGLNLLYDAIVQVEELRM
jgi:hypothetical protein